MPAPSTAKGLKASSASTAWLQKLDYAFRTTLRSLRLQILTAATRWRAPEEPKVAIHRSRSIAALHTILHMPALAGAIILLVWNIKGYYVGSISTSSLSSLQFAAKLFEILMQTSLAAVLMAVLRRQATGDSGVPLGSFLASAHTTIISYLWALDLWGALTSSYFRSVRRCFLAAFIIVIILLAAIVGPSGAVLMIPRPGRASLDTFLFIADPIEQVFPGSFGPEEMRVFYSESLSDELRQLDTAASAQLQDGAYQFYDLNGYDLNYDLSDATAVRSVFFGSPSNEYSYTEGHASIPHRRVATWLPTIFEGDSAGNRVVETSSQQPYVLVTQNSQTLFNGETTDSFGEEYLQFSPAEPALNRKFKLTDFIPKDSSSWPNGSQTAIDTGALHSACLVFSYGDYSPSIMGQTWYIDSFIIDAFWIDQRLNYTKEQSPIPTPVQSSELPSIFNDDTRAWQSKSTKISMSTAWAGRLAVVYTDTLASNPTALQLASAFALTLSSVAYPNSSDIWASHVQGSGMDERIRAYISSKKLDKKNTEVYQATVATDWTDPDTLYQLKLSRYVIGYVYSSAETTVQLALAVIALYTLIVVIYLLYSLATGHAATSWDTISELVMLTLNSKPPSHLKHVSAGVECLATFREPVQIRVNDKNSLELVFKNDLSTGNMAYRKLQANEKF